ncbi:MAG: CAP domain-containing protein [Chloroflexi bacterium]|nr:CAP domain-containing protein [Chloroflexota bacterium]
MKRDNRLLASLLSSLLVLILLLMLLPSCVGSSLTAAEVEDEIFRLVNETRQGLGFSALLRDSNLDALAGQYSASLLSDDVVQTTELRYLLRNSWWVVYSKGSPRLTEDTAQGQVDYCFENEKLREAMLRSEARATGVGVAVVDKTVYYTQVFDVLNAAGGNGEPIRLYENPRATDPTWQQLQSFLIADNTDKLTYVEGSFVCADFAATLQNRAEEMGIKAAYVSVDFADGPAHALNAFNTTDKGLVYIDCTGPGFLGTNIKNSSLINEGYDKVVYMEAGEVYGLIPLGKATSFNYEFYEQWMQLWDDYEDKVELYNSGSLSYSELANLRKEIEELREVLGDYHWEPLGTVTSFHLHW